MTPTQTTLSLSTCICGDLDCKIPYGYCHCGCGRKTSLAKVSSTQYRWVKGHPIRFIRGHSKHLKRVDLSEIRGFKIDGVLCRLIPLTRGQWTIVEESDYEYLNQWRWYAQQSPYGTKYYAIRADRDSSGKEVKIRMHRVILGLEQDDPRIGDHVRPEQTLNNTRGNLRIANAGESQCNRFMPKNNTSGFKGVHWNKWKNKYQADINVGRKHINLGYSDTPEGASLKYQAGVIKYHGKFGQVK